MTQTISHVQLAQLSDVVAAQLGLHFPRARWRDLERGIRAAAREFDLPNAAACIEWLASSPLRPPQIAVLANHLTVGETYFFRQPQVFAMLEAVILPALKHARQEGARRLRIWSAGCATGEEPYSIAISVSKVIPEVHKWDITLLATDITPRFRQTASAGAYREWSFRVTPAWVKARYFSRQAGGRFVILPMIQKLVTFAYLNLVDDIYPSPLTNTMAMDVIFCRNVLMYLAPEQAQKVVRQLYQALADGGWLVVGPSETSHALFASFQTVNIPGAILYRKDASSEPPASSQNAVAGRAAWRAAPPETLPATSPRQTSHREALALYEQRRSTAASG